MAITYDASIGNMSTTTDASATHVLGYASGNNRIVMACGVCFARKQADSVIETCTYNGVAGTLIGSAVSGASSVNVRVAAYYWLDSALPASTGSYTVAITTAKGTDSGVVATSIIGAEQQGPDHNGSGSETGASTFSTTFSVTDAGSFMIDGACIRGGETYTPDSPQVERYDTNLGFFAGLHSTEANLSSGSQTPGWTADIENYQLYAHYVTAWAAVADANNAAFFGAAF